MQGTATDHAQINDDEQQPNIDNGNSKIQQIKTTTEYDAEKPAEERQPPPPKTKANAASGKVKTKSKNRACNNPPSSTFFSWLKSLSTAFNPNIMANKLRKTTLTRMRPQQRYSPYPSPQKIKQNLKATSKPPPSRHMPQMFLKPSRGTAATSDSTVNRCCFWYRKINQI